MQNTVSCWTLSEWYEDIIRLLQNPKGPRKIMGLKNCNLSYKSLKPQAIHNFFLTKFGKKFNSVI